MRDPLKYHIETRQVLEKQSAELEQKRETKKAIITILTYILAPFALLLLLIINIKEE